MPRPPISTLFPYTTLFRSRLLLGHPDVDLVAATSRQLAGKTLAEVFPRFAHHKTASWRDVAATRDRKSTRLNSSHANISYAVFCLKKKHTITAKPTPSRAT